MHVNAIWGIFFSNTDSSYFIPVWKFDIRYANLNII